MCVCMSAGGHRLFTALPTDHTLSSEGQHARCKPAMYRLSTCDNRNNYACPSPTTKKQHTPALQIHPLKSYQIFKRGGVEGVGARERDREREGGGRDGAHCCSSNIVSIALNSACMPAVKKRKCGNIVLLHKRTQHGTATRIERCTQPVVRCSC